MSYIKCMIIMFLTIFLSIISPFQPGELHKDMIIMFLTIFLSIISPFQPVSYIKCMIIEEFD